MKGAKVSFTSFLSEFKSNCAINSGSSHKEYKNFGTYKFKSNKNSFSSSTNASNLFSLIIFWESKLFSSIFDE